MQVASPSLQSASCVQQAGKYTHLFSAPQTSIVHGLLSAQSLLPRQHSAIARFSQLPPVQRSSVQAFLSSHALLLAQQVLLLVCAQLPLLHASRVQALPSLHSASLLQQVRSKPQVPLVQVCTKQSPRLVGQSLAVTQVLGPQVPVRLMLSKKMPLPLAGVVLVPVTCALSCNWNFWPPNALASMMNWPQLLSVLLVPSWMTLLPTSALTVTTPLPAVRSMRYQILSA